jgi:hypothetical protein
VTDCPKKSNRWSDEDKKTIRELWGTCKNAELAKILNKTVSSVNYQATVLNLRQEKGYRSGGRAGIACRRWTNREQKILIDSIGHLSIVDIEKRLPGRTRSSIETKCNQLGYCATQGSFSRADIERDTGYDWRQIKRARTALRQEWKRYGKRKFIVTEDQRDDIVEYLKEETNKWCKKYNLDGCINCGATGTATKERHAGDGLCKKCLDHRRYDRAQIIKHLENNKLVEICFDNYNGK